MSFCFGFWAHENFMSLNSAEVYTFQAVYDANKYAVLVRRRDRLQNWLDYYQLKFERHPEKRPTSKVSLFISQCLFTWFLGHMPLRLRTDTLDLGQNATRKHAPSAMLLCNYAWHGSWFKISEQLVQELNPMIFFFESYSQIGFCGLWGRRVDSIDYYKEQIKILEKGVRHVLDIPSNSYNLHHTTNIQLSTLICSTFGIGFFIQSSTRSSNILN